MYNTLFGTNNLATLCVNMLGMNIFDIPRFRDAIFTLYKGKCAVEILTRTGGNNRKDYNDEMLLKHPWFLADFDDNYDSTYRHLVFRIESDFTEDEWNDFIKIQSRTSLNLKEMFEKEINEMSIEGSDANLRAKKIAQEINKAIQKIEFSDSESIVDLSDIEIIGRD